MNRICFRVVCNAQNEQNVLGGINAPENLITDFVNVNEGNGYVNGVTGGGLRTEEVTSKLHMQYTLIYNDLSIFRMLSTLVAIEIATPRINRNNLTMLCRFIYYKEIRK